MSMTGIGKRPWSASRVAAISPKVAAGNQTKDKAMPNTGTTPSTVMEAMYMKNKPAMAKG
jgi:hypothetical protein